MVGIFSRFSVSKVGHRRSQSALDEREVLPPNLEATGAVTLAGATSATTHGIEIAVEFKPVEHPIEPHDNDRPIQCPLPEPSILNMNHSQIHFLAVCFITIRVMDPLFGMYRLGWRIWKERVSAGARRSDLPVMQEGTAIEPETTGPKPRPPPHRVILPSISAPEHNILKLLEESGI
nr:uncharacterized protein LOC113707308 [Coffea arabica]